MTRISSTLLFAALALLSPAIHAQSPAPIPVGSFPMSTAVTPDGKYLLVLSTQQPSLSVIDLKTAKELNRTTLPEAWLGLALSKTGDKVYIGGGTRAAVLEYTFASGQLTAARTFPISAARDRNPQDFAGDVRFAPDGHLLYVANLYRDSITVINPQSGIILSRIKTGRRPYRILFHPSGKTMYVTSWADGTIGQYDVNSGERLANFRVAPHPIDMLWLDGGLPQGAVAPPDGIAEIKARVFVPGANTNSLFLLGASESGDLTKLESINLALTARQPLGMTPSALGISADKKQIYVACSDVNAIAVVDISGERNFVKGYIPTAEYPTAVTSLPDGRIAILNGLGDSVQIIDAPDDARLSAASDEVMAKFHYRDEMLDPPAPPAGNPIHPGGPIKHVVYVVSDSNSESAVAAIKTDYFARTQAAPVTNGPPDPASLPPAGYIWNAAAQAGLKFRNYGFQVHNLEKPNADGEQVDRVYDPILSPSTDMEYRGPDAAYPDTDRAKEFSAEMKEFEQAGDMPQLLLVRIGAFHDVYNIVADAVAKSKFRNETAIFIVSPGSAFDDGLIIAGRTLTDVRVISPWTKPTFDTTRGDPFSVLRTIEIILGLRPITIFDAAATPLFGAFSNTPTGAP